LRTEAIQLAELEPPILEVVADLDFAFLDEWQGMLAQWSMQLPPQLERGIAARINAAYAELQPLEQLMRRHRLLALARAPLSARIDVLRQINQRDEMNLAWKVDLVNYEDQRFRQIRSEAADARRSCDLAHLEELHRELTGSVWTSEIPQEVLQEVELNRDLILRQEGRKTLEQLVPELDRTYGELNYERAATLSDYWRHTSRLIGLDPADPLVARVEEALRWVDEQSTLRTEQQDFQKSLERIEVLLDDHAPAQKLESEFLKAERYGLPIPDLLRNRVGERLEVLQAYARRRNLVIGMSATLAIAILVAATFYHWRNVHLEDTVALHAQNLGSLLEGERWQAALNYYEDMPAALRQSPRLMELNTKSREGAEAESQRVETLAKLFDNVEAMDVSEPDLQLLAQIKSFVKSSDEKHRLSEIELKVRNRQRELQRDRDEAFLEVVSRWSAKLAELERSDTLSGVDLRRMFDELYSELEQHTSVTASLRKRGEPLTSKLRALVSEQDELSQERGSLQSLAKVVGSPEDFVSALERVAKRQPATTASTHAAQVLANKDAWLSTNEWANFWRSWRSKWTDIGPEAAAQVLKEGEALEHSTLKIELSHEFDRRKPHLKSIVNRKDVDLTKLKSTLIQNALISNVWVIVDTEGRRDYSPKKPVEDNSKELIRFEHFTDYSSTKEVSRQKRFITTYGLSPQAKCADRFDESLSNLTDANWDTTFGNMAYVVRKAVDANPPLDEVLALDMLRRILNVGSEGSVAIRETFRAVNDEIENAGVDLSVAWFLPQDRDADAARRDAGALIRGLPDFKALSQKLRQIQQSECMPPEHELRWIGMLNRDSAGKWQCEPKLENELDGTLLVASEGTPGSARLSTVADVRSGTITWRVSDGDATLLIGAPLFLRTASLRKP